MTPFRESVSIHRVKEYWENNPLHSYETDDYGTSKFYEFFDKIKREDVERFTHDYWQFAKHGGSRILDVGCGPGWITVNYALGGAKVHAIDLTRTAVELTKKHLVFRNGPPAHVMVSNAEQINYLDNAFDLVVSSGVLHHTPNYMTGIAECFRVLRPGGEAKLTFYRKGILHSSVFFRFIRIFMQLMKVKHPGADMAQDAKNVDDFIRQYDGKDNPVGVGKTDKEWEKILRSVGFIVVSREIHFFPVRFLPFHKYIPKTLHKILDNYFGTMIYFSLKKPTPAGR